MLSFNPGLVGTISETLAASVVVTMMVSSLSTTDAGFTWAATFYVWLFGELSGSRSGKFFRLVETLDLLGSFQGRLVLSVLTLTKSSFCYVTGVQSFAFLFATTSGANLCVVVVSLCDSYFWVKLFF